MSIICKFGIHSWKRDGKFSDPYRKGKRRYVCRFNCGAVGNW